jgi:hypothetical protein
MDNPVYRSACLGAAIALVLTLVVAALAGGGPMPTSAPDVTAMEAPSPTLEPIVPGAKAPAAP